MGVPGTAGCGAAVRPRSWERPRTPRVARP
jgi:hypothetical protein